MSASFLTLPAFASGALDGLQPPHRPDLEEPVAGPPPGGPRSLREDIDDQDRSRESAIQQDVADLPKLAICAGAVPLDGRLHNFAISFSIISILTGAVILYGLTAWPGRARLCGPDWLALDHGYSC